MKQFTLCVLFSISLLLSGCRTQSSQSFITQSRTNTKIQQEINVGYISYAPGFIVDPNTKKMSGITHDILEEIATRKNITINHTTEVTRASLVETLNTEKVTMIASPVRITPEREANADFSTPLYFSPIGAYARIDDTRFTNKSIINNPNTRIISVDGEGGQVIARTEYSGATLIALPNTSDLSQLLLEVQNNKADITFLEPIFAYEYMQKNPGKLKNVTEDEPIKLRPNSFMFKTGNTELQSIIDGGIQELREDGTLDKIIDRYEPFPGAITRIK